MVERSDAEKFEIINAVISSVEELQLAIAALRARRELKEPEGKSS
jgi:hypothetical protein